jgi:hypothetical protein
MFNCGMCGRPTNNPQAVCKLCRKAKERQQKREERRDTREEKDKDLWDEMGSEEEEDEVWFDEEE